MISLRNIRLVSFSPFQVSSLRDVSCVPLLVSSPSLPLWLECIFSSWLNPLSPIDVYRRLYKFVCGVHLLRSIGELNDGNSAILKGAERLGNT